MMTFSNTSTVPRVSCLRLYICFFSRKVQAVANSSPCRQPTANVTVARRSELVDDIGSERKYSRWRIQSKNTELRIRTSLGDAACHGRHLFDVMLFASTLVLPSGRHGRANGNTGQTRGIRHRDRSGGRDDSYNDGGGTMGGDGGRRIGGKAGRDSSGGRGRWGDSC